MAALRVLSQADVAAFYRVRYLCSPSCILFPGFAVRRRLAVCAARCGTRLRAERTAWRLQHALWACTPPHCRNPPPPALQERVLDPATRRKLSVHIEGHRPAGADAAGAAAEGGTAAAPQAGAAPAAEGTGSGAAAGGGKGGAVAQKEEAAAEAAAGPELERITDLYAWKRRQQLFGSFK